MSSPTGPAPTSYGATAAVATSPRVATAYRIAARVVLGLSALATVGVVALCVAGATDPGGYAGFWYLFAILLAAPVLVALALLWAARWLRPRAPRASLALACVAAAGMTWLAFGALAVLWPF